MVGFIAAAHEIPTGNDARATTHTRPTSTTRGARVTRRPTTPHVPFPLPEVCDTSATRSPLRALGPFSFEKGHPHRMEASHANLTALRATRTPTHANTRAAGALHDPLRAHRVKTARTSPRARKHAQRHYRAVPCASALCWHPMAVPSRPHQPRASRTTRARRTTTHAATRAPQCTSH